MRTNLFKQMFNQLGNAKGVVLTLMAVVCLPFAMPQGAKAEIKKDTLKFTSLTSAAYLYGRDVQTAIGSSVKKNAYRVDTFMYNNYGIHLAFSNTAFSVTDTTSTNEPLYTNQGLRATSSTNSRDAVPVHSITFSTEASGIYISKNTWVKVRTVNGTSGSDFTKYANFNLNANATKSSKQVNGAVTDWVLKNDGLTDCRSFYISMLGRYLSKTHCKPGITNMFLERIIPEVKSAAYQEYGADYSHDVGTMEKNTTSSTQTLVFDVADGQAVGDFRATITKNSGSGTFSTPSLSLNAAGDKLTVTFTYTSGNADEPINGTMVIESVNTVNTTSYSIGIGGTVGSAKNANTLAWDIAASQFVNATYLQTEYLTGKNSDGPIHVTLSNQSPAGVAELQTGDKIKFTKAGTVKVTVEQEETEDFEGAVRERTFTVSKRTAVFSYAQSTLFTETEYPGLISVTNDPNGTLLPNLSYGGAAPTYMEIDEDGTLTTKTGVGNSLALNITYAGDEEWNPVSESHNFKIVYKLPTPEFSLSGLDHMSDRVSDGVFIRKTLGTGTASWADGKLTLTGGSGYSVFVIRFDGIPSRLQYNLSSAVLHSIAQSADGEEYQNVTAQAGVTASTGDFSLLETTHYLKITIFSSATAVFNTFCIKTEPTFTVNRTAVTVQTDGEISTPASFSVTPNDLKRVTISSSNPHFVVTPAELDTRFSSNTPMPVEVDFNGSDFDETATLTINGYDNDNNPVSTVRTVAASVNFFHDTHYAKAQAFVGSEGGSGTVYVSLNSTTPSGSSYAASSERASACGGAGQDDITFHYWAKNGDGYEFEGWYGMMDEETGELNDLISADEHFAISLTATSTDPADPTTGTLYANFIESATTAAPVYALEDLNLGSVASGEGGLTDRMALLPDGEYTRPLYIDRTRTTVAFSDIAGHAGESSLFSASAYNSGTKAFDITFTPTGVHPTSHTYQALATVTATNDIGTTIRTAVISATVTPAPLATFTVEANHTFADKQRNQTDTWNAVVGSLTNATTTPVITFTGANAEYFSAGAWDAENHLFPITFAPTAVGANYTATATISVQNYDEVVTSHTITLKGTCVAAPAAVYDVKDSENQSVVGGDLYFGDFNPGEQATRKLYLVDIANMKEAPGYVPTISMEPDIEGEFVSAAYNASTHSFDVTFHAYGRTDEEMGVRSVPVTITMLNNDDVPVFKEFTLSAFVVKPADFDVRVTSSTGIVLVEGTWAEGLAEANKTANAGCTLTLMRNVTGLTSYQTITNTFTLELNGKKLSGKSNSSIIYVNGAGQTLTIRDSKGNGIIENINNAYAGIAYGVNINAGTLVLHSGTVYVENKGASERKAVGINVKANTNATINGGKVEVYGYTDTYGVFHASDQGSNINITFNNGEIYTEGYQNIYGIVAYSQVNINGGTIGAKATYTNSRGIFLGASASTTASSCYNGVLTMTGGTINSTCTADADGERLAYGIYFSCSNAAMGDATATDGSHANKAAAVGTISNATINASTLGRKAYGVWANGSYNSKTNTYDKIQINNSVVNATANYYYSYGVYATGDINDTHGAIYFANIELNDCEVNATTTKNYTAYGVWATTAAKTIFQADQPKYYGEYAGGATITINSGTYTATTGTTYAYAVGTSARSKTIYNPLYKTSAERRLSTAGAAGEGYATLNINGGTFIANAGTTTARAVSNGGNCTIIGGEFYATTGTTTADGIYNLGRLTATGAKIVSIATTNTAYGVRTDVSDIPAGNQAWTGFTYRGESELNNLDVTVTTGSGSTAYGVYANAKALLYTTANFETQKTSSSWSDATYTVYKAVSRLDQAFADSAYVTVNGGTYNVTAETSTAYGAFSNTTAVAAAKAKSASAVMNLKNAKFVVKTNQTTEARGIYSSGRTTIDGCDITATSKTTTAYGVLVADKKTTITNSKITVTATNSDNTKAANAFGIYGTVDINATHGYKRYADIELNEGNVVTATTTSGTTAYALFLNATKRNIASGDYAGDYAVAAKAVINGGKYTATAAGTTGFALCVAAQQVQGAAVAQPELTVNDGKFKGAASSSYAEINTNGKAGHVVLNGGYYVNSTNLNTYAASDKVVTALANTRTEYSEGYRYEIAPPGGNYVCQIGSTKYKTLEEALSVVTSGQVIYMIADYTLPAGDYILPSGATLLVPYTTSSGKGGTTAIGAAAVTTTSATTPTLFRKLTFASGANLTSFGTIETSAQQKANGQYGANVGMASGPYGQLDLKEGSHIEMENGANLYCWGFVTGKGTINVKKGANTLEGFQLGDWCGGTNASNLIGNSQKVFPITHYFFQSIECPITYRPGSTAKGSTHINVSFFGVVGQDAISLVGTSGAMFLMTNEDASADTWVMRDYDETTDQCVWTLNSGASIGNLTINISGYNMASKDYDLPITTNMTIVMNYGTMSIGQNVVFFPGSKLIVNKEGTALINGVSVVLYDTDDWTGTKRYFATYSPSWGTTNPRSKIALTDAEAFVHGKIEIKGNGGLYTSAGSANIHSTNEDAGEIIYTTAAQGNKTSYFLVQGGTNKTALTVNPAKLKNGAGITPAFSESAGTAAGKTWTYYEDKWQCWTQASNCVYFDAINNPYAKPDEFVQLTDMYPDLFDNVYFDKETGNRVFVWDENCYWWEVNPTPVEEGIYRSINEDHNGKLNCYEYDEGASCWKIKNVTVTWNGEGVTTTNYTNVGYGISPKWLGATPTKSGYVWDGWQINGAGTVYTNDNLPVVTSNTTFTSHFVSNPVKYNITFKNDDGKVLESKNWESGATPSYSGGTPTKDPTASQAFTWNGTWSPAITTVSAAKEYTAQYTANTRQYDVTFLDYDNTELETKKVNYNVTPSYTGDPSTPTRVDPEDYYEYTFSGWKNQQTGTSGLSAVQGDQVYVAQYTQTIKWAFISFADYNGTTITTGKVLRGTAPTPPANPTRESDAQYIYSFNAWSPAITNADENQTYTATYNTTLRSYTIRFVDYKGDNLKDPQVLPYGSKPTAPTSVPDKSESEEFANWDDVIRTVSEAKDYIAQYRTKRYTLTIASNNTDYGTVSPTSLTNIPHGSTVAEGSNTFTVDEKTVTATPTAATAQYTYTFDHWANLPATITGNKDDIQAVFTRTLNQYTITGASAGNGSVSGSGTYDYGATATLTATPDDGYRFDHWNDDNTDNPRSLSVTATATYTATFVSDETGDYLDIVDWTNSTVTINANGWTASGWPYTVNGTPYAKNSRNADRTLTIPYSGDAGTNLTISVASGSVISNRMYPIPFINTIDGTTETSVVYINSGKLTIDGSKTLAAVYVAPGAELEITGSLTVGKLFLRTDNARSAILTNTGTLTATNVYYTRITRSNATYDQFGLPLDCALSSVTMSNAGKLGSSEMPYGSAWNLKSYNEASRAEYGKQDDGSNWTLLAADATIKGGTGYQMMSTSKYFREYYFPVDLSLLSNSVPVSYTEGAAGPDHRGWNIICSPLTSVYTVISADPATGIKLNWLEPAGDAYVQEPASTILPARPFAFQTTESCTELVFNNDHSLVYHAPRRVAAADNTETEWLHLDIKDANNRGDQTSLYVHPSRFDEVYEAGVDVAKLSFSASHALLYSSHAYGEMAFAGVADELLEQGVALTVYSPKAQELTISMRNNEWLHRMAFVWLIDQATGAQIDLLESDYSFNAEAGTTAGRFILMGAFFAPQITTDNGTVQGDEGVKATKFIYKDKMYIKIDGVLYDATGKLVRK